MSYTHPTFVTCSILQNNYTCSKMFCIRYWMEDWQKPRQMYIFKDRMIIIFNLHTAAFKAYREIWVRLSNFRHQASPRESTQRRKAELCATNVRKFCLNADFHITFRDLLHAVKLRHGTDGFNSPPKEGVLGIFRPKNPTASAGCEPANLGTKGQHATSRPPKPLCKTVANTDKIFNYLCHSTPQSVSMFWHPFYTHIFWNLFVKFDTRHFSVR